MANERSSTLIKLRTCERCGGHADYRIWCDHNEQHFLCYECVSLANQLDMSMLDLIKFRGSREDLITANAANIKEKR